MASSGHPDLSVIIVNWNSREYLRRCLQTVFAETELAMQVLVIDNASYDGSREMVEAEFPQALFIQSNTNAGFARANNAAAMSATARNLLFLNPDTEAQPGALRRMVRFLDATPVAGAIGCRLLNTDGSLQTSCVQAFPTVLNQMLDSELLRRLLPRSSLWGTVALADDARAPVRVEGISGACLLVNREAFDAVGGFTDEYFMYAEDMDLCYKLYRSGRANYYLGDAVVVHHGGQSSTASSESQFGNVLMRESIAKFLRRHHGALHAGAYRFGMGAVALGRLLVLAAAQVVSLGTYRGAAVRGGLRKWSSILRWTVGAEGWVRNPGAGSS